MCVGVLFANTNPLLMAARITFYLTAPNKRTVASFHDPLLYQVVSSTTTKTFAVVVAFGSAIA